jgi:hypothetical protein
MRSLVTPEVRTKPCQAFQQVEGMNSNESAFQSTAGRVCGPPNWCQATNINRCGHGTKQRVRDHLRTLRARSTLNEHATPCSFVWLETRITEKPPRSSINAGFPNKDSHDNWQSPGPSAGREMHVGRVRHSDIPLTPGALASMHPRRTLEVVSDSS